MDATLAWLSVQCKGSGIEDDKGSMMIADMYRKGLKLKLVGDDSASNDEQSCRYNHYSAVECSQRRREINMQPTSRSNSGSKRSARKPPKKITQPETLANLVWEAGRAESL